VQRDYLIGPLRWHLKKISRRAAIGLSRHWPGASGPRLRVLTYHRFGTRRYDPVAIPPEAFEGHLRWLSEHAQVIDAAGFAGWLDGTRQIRHNTVLITVDDGHYSFYEHALPILRRYGFSAVLFVCPDLIEADEPPPAPARPREFMSWRELEAVQAQGLTIGSHGLSHRSLARMSPREAEAEIVAAQAVLESRLGTRSPWFAFPFGTRADFSDRLARFLVRRGYDFCFTSIHGHCRPPAAHTLLPRLKIEAGEDLELFGSIVEGHLDNWSVVDNAAWWIQQRQAL